jgi:tetraacyldisaccharide 4'-kinase
MRRAKRLKTKGIYFLYRILQGFALPALLLYFVFRGLRNRGYWRSLPQRFGFLPRSFRQTGPGAIWLHAVSVGEVLACVELVRSLRAAFPRIGLFVSTSTLAGRAAADHKLGGLADGVFYAPADFVFAVRRVLRTLRPSVVVIAETEIWPNLIRETRRTGAGVTIVNGRISDRALPRYLRFRWFFRAALAGVDSVLAQTDAMRERFLALGTRPESVRAAGNLKYDFVARPPAPGSPVLSLIERLRPEEVWIAASTTVPAAPGDVDEDDAVLAAFAELAVRHPRLLLILAPRKPERFPEAARKLAAAGVANLQRSTLGPTDTLELPGVLLLDTIGELSGLFSIADVVFMGGSLARRGGHNILEPALFAKPVVAGPHMENFQAIAEEFRAAEAYLEIGGPGDLAPAVGRLLADTGAAREIGRRALGCAEARRGAGARALAEVRELHARSVPWYRPAMPWLALARPLAGLWEWGGRGRRARGLARRRTLDIPVIGVGNLTMGGTGKTPCVLLLAEVLKKSGRKPGILTRGYARSSPQRQLVLEPGALVSAERSGDEPQIFVRSGLAPVGIGGDRFEAGRLLCREFDVDVLLLDDGFQHARLARSLDIVLIDALEPFGRGGVFPLGRLREPLAALERAGVILITRSGFSDLAEAIEQETRSWNPNAPIFRADVQPLAWVDQASGVDLPLDPRPFERAGVFCGLGNPLAFRRTLERMGVHPVDWVEFEDHHSYRPRELRHMAHQFRARRATALVTTEKDAVNLCESWPEMVAPMRLYWLKAAMRIDREDEFVREVLKRLG